MMVRNCATAPRHCHILPHIPLTLLGVPVRLLLERVEQVDIHEPKLGRKRRLSLGDGDHSKTLDERVVHKHTRVALGR